MQKNSDYIRGYKLSASRIKIKNIAIYSVAGLTIGFVILGILGK